MSQTPAFRHPSSFLSSPGHGGHQPQATPIQNPGLAVPRAPYVHRAAPRLTVRADCFITLNAEAARLLPDGDGTIDLRPPVRERDAWHLDCRPGGHYRRLPVGTSGGIRFKAAPRARAILGIGVEALHFELEHVGNGLFRLCTETVNN